MARHRHNNNRTTNHKGIRDMKTMRSIYRIAVLAALSAVAFIGVFSEPADGSGEAAFLAPKLAGFAAAYAACRLYARWRSIDRWLSAYDAWCNRGD